MVVRNNSNTLIINKHNIDKLYSDISSYACILIEPEEYILNETICFRNCDNIIIKSSDDMRKPIFNFVNQKYGENGIVVEGDNIIIENIIIKNSGYKGLLCYANNSVFNGIETFWNCNSGFQIKNGGNNVVINCLSHHNIDYKTVKDGKIKYGANADGFSDKQHDATPNKFINCVSWNNSDDGFDFYERVTDNYTIIENCEAFNNGLDFFDLTDCERRLTTDKDFFEQFTEEQIKQFQIWQWGNGLKLGGKQTHHNVKCINCFAHDNQKNGFDKNFNNGDIILIECKANNNGINDFCV